MRTTILIALTTAALAADGDWPSPVTWKPDQRAVDSGLYIKPHEAAKREKVAFTVSEPSGVARKRYPVRGSVALYRGELADPAHVRLIDAAGKEVPVQAKITAYWPEKTARFMCLDFLVDLDAKQEAKFTLEYGSELKAAAAMKATAKEKGAEVATGVVAYAFKPGSEFLQVAYEKKSALKPITGQAVVCADEKGASPSKLPLIIDDVAISELGPVQTTVHLSGHYGSDRSGKVAELQSETWRYPASLYFRVYANTGHVYVEHSFGYNGDEYKDFVQSYGLTIPTGLSKGTFAYGPDENSAAESPLGVRLNQYAHNEWTLTGKAETKGKRFGGWGAIQDKNTRVVVGMREGWQNWPVAIRADENGDLGLEILGEKPDRTLDLRYEDRSQRPTTFIKSHSMYVGDGIGYYYYNEEDRGAPGSSARGLMKLHELFIDFAPAAPASDIAKAFQKPLVPWADTQRIADTKVVGHIGVYGDPKYDHAKDYFSVLLDGYPLVHESLGLYGWVDWGDMPMFETLENDRLKMMMYGGCGWSNGERAVQAYFTHYLAGGGRRFLDLGHTMVHHTIGIDTEHAGGDQWQGGYLRHNQVHWRHAAATRQGGYRGWHEYYWLTGDPEVGRLCIVEGVDAPANNVLLNVLASQAEATVGQDFQHSATHMLAHCCWITTGDWRFARATHAVVRVYATALEKGVRVKQGWEFFKVGKDGEPIGYQLGGPGVAGDGYWLTYGGDDLLVEWASMTGDPVAVDAILGEMKAFENAPERIYLYCPPEHLFAGAALLTHEGRLRGLLDWRYRMHLSLPAFKSENRKTPDHYDSLAQWYQLGGSDLRDKNGLSIVASEAGEFASWMFADQTLAEDPTPAISVPLKTNMMVGKKTAPVEVDGSATQKGASGADVTAYEWFLDGVSVAKGAKATLSVAEGLHSVTLKATDAKGHRATATRPVTVWPADLIWQLGFFGGPPGYVEGMRRFDANVGHGWSSGSEFHVGGCEGQAWREKSRNCGQYFGDGPDPIYQIAVPPGTYHLEMGGATQWYMAHGPISLQGKVVVPGKVTDTHSCDWSYDGDVTVGSDGLIAIKLSYLTDDKGQNVKDKEGNHSYQFISYIVVKKK